FPVIGGGEQSGMDILGTTLRLSDDRRFLSVTTKVIDLSNPGATALSITGTNFLQYVTRWQFGNTIYYAAMENTLAKRPTFYAGKAQSIDLCSVSACFPHVITYPEPHLGGNSESGTINCPATPSVSNPRSVTVEVRVLDVEDVHSQDAAANMNFHSTEILSAIFNDATDSVTLLGNGTDNGSPVTFTAVAVHGLAGVGAFSLILSDGYTNSGTLLDGSIQLH